LPEESVLKMAGSADRILTGCGTESLAPALRDHLLDGARRNVVRNLCVDLSADGKYQRRSLPPSTIVAF
jgi:hypothetical protein